MADFENRFTVFVRLPFNRGDFVDPAPVSWSAAKERALWDVISRQGQGKGNEIDWNALADQFNVTQPFILQQAAWLYERQLSQVRAQLRKVGNRQSATPSPASVSVASSIVGPQAGRGAGSRAPSRLSTQHAGSPSIAPQGSTPPTPGKSRTSLPLRGPQKPQGRGAGGPGKPLSRQPSKEVDAAQYSHSRRGSAQVTQLSRSPGQTKAAMEDSDSDPEPEQMNQSKYISRRANPSSLHRRSLSLRKDRVAQAAKVDKADTGAEADDDEDDAAGFLPFAADQHESALSRQTTASAQDPGATLRGALTEAAQQRPKTHRRSTSERIVSPTKTKADAVPEEAKPQPMSASTSSLSSASGLRTSTGPSAAAMPPAQPQRSGRSARTLSPRQQATLASAGLSPRRQGSESSPSMGSSFSDLDDASVTQSALEEALMSGMANTVTSRVGGISGISQALRSRYFDARQGER
jgi:hypothetical protein